jgi:hypothetical protein
MLATAHDFLRSVETPFFLSFSWDTIFKERREKGQRSGGEPRTTNPEDDDQMQRNDGTVRNVKNPNKWVVSCSPQLGIFE